MEGCGHAQGLQSAAGCNSPREESRSDATEEEIGNAALAWRSESTATLAHRSQDGDRWAGSRGRHGAW